MRDKKTHRDVVEYWKPVQDCRFMNSYEVSSLGRVRSLDRYVPKSTKARKISGKVLATRVRKDGYLTVNLNVNGKGYQYAVHRLIASVFVENASSNPLVNHKNGIKTDNRAENLEWVTHQQNTDHAIAIGLIDIARGANNEQFKGLVLATNKKTLNTIKFQGKKSLIEFGFDHSAVYGCISGRIKSHKGYTFSRITNKPEVSSC